MISDTPRTDSKVKCIDESDIETSEECFNHLAYFARQLESELAEARKEIEWLKRETDLFESKLKQAQTSDVERRAFIAELESVQQGLINDSDRWRKMAEDLAERLLIHHGMPAVSDCRSCEIIARFNAMKG